MVRYIFDKSNHLKEHNETKPPLIDGRQDLCCLYSKINNHISDGLVHVTDSERNSWNNKADQSTVELISNSLKTVSDTVDSIKIPDISNLATKNDIAKFIDTEHYKTMFNTDILDYATKKYLLSYVGGIFDENDYYTKREIDTKISDSQKDYKVDSISINDNVLSISLSGIDNTKTVNLLDAFEVSQTQFDKLLKSSSSIHTLTAKGKTYNPIVSDVDISDLFTNDGSGTNSSYYKPYFINITEYDSFPSEYLPTNGMPPSDLWSSLLVNPEEGEYTWMTQVFIGSDGSYGDYFAPVRITGQSGSDGKDGSFCEYIYYVGLTKPTGSIQDPSKWDTSVEEFLSDGYILNGSGWTNSPSDLTKQGLKQFVSTRKTNNNIWSAYSSPALWSYYSKDGDAQAQEMVGSPLRMKGEWNSSTTYYDGKKLIDGCYYQDVVIYNNAYYICISLLTGETTPDLDSLHFEAISTTDDMFVNMLIVNKAYILDLSSREVVVMDNNKVVAGMTSGEANNKSEISSYNKGNVRIWAGLPTDTGNLTTAPFTVTDLGVITSSGKDYTVIIDNGVIYFKTGSTTYHLGLNDSGKPDWLSEKQYVYSHSYKSDINSTSTTTLYSTDNVTFYEDVNLTKKASSTLYELEYSEFVLIENSSAYYIGANYIDLKIYKKILFVDGVASTLGFVAYGYSFYNNVSAGELSLGSNKGYYTPLESTNMSSKYYDISSGNAEEISSSNITVNSDTKYYPLTFSGYTELVFSTYSTCEPDTDDESKYYVKNNTAS